MNSAVGCYRDQTSTHLFGFGDASSTKACDTLGIVQISNRLVLPPDGLTLSKTGLLGVSYLKTPLGKTAASDDRAYWTLLLDTDGFKGPVLYFLPEFFDTRPVGYEQQSAWLPDFGDGDVAANLGAPGYEWNTIKAYRASDGSYKIPKMVYPPSPIDPSRSVLITHPRKYSSADLHDPLDEWLSSTDGSAALDAASLMAGGQRASCYNSNQRASYRLDNTRGVYANEWGTLRTSVEDGECVWSLKLDGAPADGAAPAYFDKNGNALDEADAPPELVQQSFPQKTSFGPYDGIGRPPSGGCTASPGAADDNLYCARTSSPSWVAYKWYKFVEQPAMQRANLDSNEKAYLQGRIEKLHRQLNADGGASAWIKSRGAEAEGLAALEGSQLVTPPPGLEVGYVPVPLYEGIEKHQDCVDPPTTCAQLSALKNIRGEDKWCSDLTSQGAVRCAEHFIQRSNGRYSPCVFEGGNCVGAQLMLTCPSPPPPPPPPEPCNQQNKQKAMYANFEHEPPLSVVPALDMIGDVVIGDLESLKAHGANGIYSAFMLYWKPGTQSGYMGPQVDAKRLNRGEPQQVLFSLWDKNPGSDYPTWKPVFPMHENCKRNCNDCPVAPSKHDDGSTGTQCKVFIPRYANQELRMRVRRVEAEGSVEMYGRTWTGDVWEVTVQDLGTGELWTVGRQLIADQTSGITRTSAFNEHIGCTPCDAFDESEVRRGPWVLEPPGTKLVGATSKYSNTREAGFTCHRHAVTSDAFGEVTFASGPSSAEQPGSGAWDKTLYNCDGAGGCATPRPPPPPSPSPPVCPSMGSCNENSPWLMGKGHKKQRKACKKIRKKADKICNKCRKKFTEKKHTKCSTRTAKAWRPDKCDCGKAIERTDPIVSGVSSTNK